MSTVSDLQAKLEKAKLGSLLPSTSGWLSRKLVVVLAVVAALIVIGRENVSLIVICMTVMACVYMIIQGIIDFGHDRNDTVIRGQLIAAAAKDGLTAEELKELSTDTQKTA